MQQPGLRGREQSPGQEVESRRRPCLSCICVQGSANYRLRTPSPNRATGRQEDGEMARKRHQESQEAAKKGTAVRPSGSCIPRAHPRPAPAELEDCAPPCLCIPIFSPHTKRSMVALKGTVRSHARAVGKGRPSWGQPCHSPPIPVHLSRTRFSSFLICAMKGLK